MTGAHAPYSEWTLDDVDIILPNDTDELGIVYTKKPTEEIIGWVEYDAPERTLIFVLESGNHIRHASKVRDSHHVRVRAMKMANFFELNEDGKIKNIYRTPIIITGGDSGKGK